MPDLAFFVFLVADGALAGSIYALVALAFVVVYKGSRMINFAVGEWTMLGARTAAAASHTLGLALGVGIFMRGAATLVFAGIPPRIASPFPVEPLLIAGVPISVDKVASAAIAAACIAALSWFFHGSRT